MREHVIAAILGVVEGLTEFLPVSSTGHLIVVGELLQFTGPVSDTFKIFIQLGAILAVLVYYRSFFLGIVLSPAPGTLGGRRALGLLLLTTLPALIVGWAAHDFIKQHLFFHGKVAAGLIMGSLWILFVEQFQRGREPKELHQLDWKTALGIGLFQCAALWPGISRSAATILGALLLGLNRRAATEYSFLAAAPIIVIATVYDTIKNWPILTVDTIPYFTTGILVAFLSAWLAIKLFIRYVSRHSLRIFAWYRLILAVIILWLMD